MTRSLLWRKGQGRVHQPNAHDVCFTVLLFLLFYCIRVFTLSFVVLIHQKLKSTLLTYDSRLCGFSCSAANNVLLISFFSCLKSLFCPSAKAMCERVNKFAFIQPEKQYQYRNNIWDSGYYNRYMNVKARDGNRKSTYFFQYDPCAIHKAGIWSFIKDRSWDRWTINTWKSGIMFRATSVTYDSPKFFPELSLLYQFSIYSTACANNQFASSRNTLE